MLAENRFSTLSTVLDAALVSRIQNWIYNGPDSELFRINLRKWSSAWATPLPTVLMHFLHLTHSGIMDLSWDMHCPQCNVILSQEPVLAKVSGTHYCHFCLKDVSSKLDDHFEVTFTPNPAVRKVGGRASYEPSANVEVLAKANLKPHTDAQISMAVPDRVHNLRLVSWPPTQVRVIPTGPARDLHITFLGGESVQAPDFFLTGDNILTVQNLTDAAANILIEDHDMREYRPDERSPRLTGLDVISSPTFRELFGAETLSERENIAIRDISLLFTDISGSTELYRKLGNASAYSVVRDHFELLFDEIGKNEGTVVKTIGDAVMASFVTPLSGLKAAIALQRRFRDEEFEQRGITIRAGLHHGMVLAVNLNNRLDFFGQAVNEAARIESQSRANELVISQAVYESDGVDHALSGCAIARFETKLKGLGGEYVLYRVIPK